MTDRVSFIRLLSHHEDVLKVARAHINSSARLLRRAPACASVVMVMEVRIEVCV